MGLRSSEERRSILPVGSDLAFERRRESGAFPQTWCCFYSSSLDVDLIVRVTGCGKLAQKRMPIAPGDRLGPSEILSPLGAGGMGEVYKARDTRLDRSVAVKVLPEHIAKREDLRGRFEREARAVASLNHPNICTLFDIGAQDGISYMVMELMEGETLAARIEKGPIPLDQALSFAQQIGCKAQPLAMGGSRRLRFTRHSLRHLPTPQQHRVTIAR